MFDSRRGGYGKSNELIFVSPHLDSIPHQPNRAPSPDRLRKISNAFKQKCRLFLWRRVALHARSRQRVVPTQPRPAFPVRGEILITMAVNPNDGSLVDATQTQYSQPAWVPGPSILFHRGPQFRLSNFIKLHQKSSQATPRPARAPV